MKNPASPSEILKAQAKCEHIPSFVLKAVDRLLTIHLKNNYASFDQDEIIKEIQKSNPEIKRREIFANKWLDFEPLYRDFGWEVEYEKGAYYDTFTPYFEFKVKKTD